MRKITLILMSLFLTLGAVAQTPITHEQFDASKTYRVYNTKSNSSEGKKAWSVNGSKGALADYNGSAANQVWRFVSTNDDKFYIYNVKEDKYMQGVQGSDGVNLTSYINSAMPYHLVKHSTDGKRYAFCHNVDDPRHCLYNDGNNNLYGWTNEADEWFYLEECEPVYEYTIPNLSVYSERWLGSIDVVNNNRTSIISLHESKPSQDRTTKYDKTSQIVTVVAGTEMNVTFNYNGEWMHAYVYIDEGKDGFTASVGSDGMPGGDLKSYSFYSSTDASTGFNSAGEQVPNGNKTFGCPSFTAPQNSGQYRMRFKVDWNNIDPNGGSDDISKGGAFVDITLKVVPADITVNLVEILGGDNLLSDINGNYIGTFSAPHATSVPENTVAYYAQLSENSEYLKLESIGATIPAGQGVILVATESSVSMAYTESDASIVTSPLLGTAGNSVDMVTGDYILTRPNGYSAGFYPAKGTLSANKAFLRLGSQNTSAFRLVVDETTAIENVATEKVDGAIYDLTGRRVLNTVKGGIYIQNGKKFIVK